MVAYLLETHYYAVNRPLRRCHPRDLLGQIRDFCVYNDLPLEMRREHFGRVVRSYFTVMLKGETVTRRAFCAAQAVN